jgi:hypothetical protein
MAQAMGAMGRERCLALLARGTTGRLLFAERALPAVALV